MEIFYGILAIIGELVLIAFILTWQQISLLKRENRYLESKIKGIKNFR